MVRENPISVILIYLIVVVAVVGQMIEKKSGLGLRAEVEGPSGVIPVLVLVVLVILFLFVALRRGQLLRR